MQQAPFPIEPFHWPLSHLFAIICKVNHGKGMCVANALQLPEILLHFKRWKQMSGLGMKLSGRALAQRLRSPKFKPQDHQQRKKLNVEIWSFQHSGKLKQED